MASKSTGSFFHISPRVFVIMVIYIILIYTVVYAFAVPDNSSFGIVKPEDMQIDTVTPENESIFGNFVGHAGTGAVGGFVTALPIGIAIGIGAIFLSVLFPPAALVLFPAGITAISAFTSAVTITASVSLIGAGIGALTNGIWGTITGNDIAMPFADIVRLLTNYIGSVATFIGFVAKMVTFNYGAIIDLAMPEYMQFIVFFMTFPVWICILLWITGLALEIYKSIKIPLLG